MKYGYYPGCSLHATAKEYDLSTRAVCDRLGIELAELADWSCCGASAAHNTGHLLGVALAARNLSLAEEQGADDLLVPCAACYHRLMVAHKEMAASPGVREQVLQATGRKYEGRVGVRSVLEVFSSLDSEKLSAKITRPLKGLKVASYYGCLLLRPPAVTGFDDPEQPRLMDNLVRLTGASPVEWGYKTECCGASHSVTSESVALKLGRDILENAYRAGADCLVCACPLCQNNLDSRQSHINRAYGTSLKMPVLYLTQLIGLAFGIETRALGLNTLFVDPRPIIQGFI